MASSGPLSLPMAIEAVRHQDPPGNVRRHRVQQAVGVVEGSAEA